MAGGVTLALVIYLLILFRRGTISAGRLTVAVGFYAAFAVALFAILSRSAHRRASRLMGEPVSHLASTGGRVDGENPGATAVRHRLRGGRQVCDAFSPLPREGG